MRYATHFGQRRSIVGYTGRFNCEYCFRQLSRHNGCLVRHVENVASQCHVIISLNCVFRPISAKLLSTAFVYFSYRTILAVMLATCQKYRISHFFCTVRVRRHYFMRPPSSRPICVPVTGNSCIHSLVDGKCHK